MWSSLRENFWTGDPDVKRAHKELDYQRIEGGSAKRRSVGQTVENTWCHRAGEGRKGEAWPGHS